MRQLSDVICSEWCQCVTEWCVKHKKVETRILTPVTYLLPVWVRLWTTKQDRHLPWWWVPGPRSWCPRTRRRWVTLLCRREAWTWRASWTGRLLRREWTAPSAPHWSYPWLKIVTLLVTSHKTQIEQNNQENGKIVIIIWYSPSIIEQGAPKIQE